MIESFFGSERCNVKLMSTKIFDLAGKRIYVAGHRGMVGSAIVRRLAGVGSETITAGRAEVDLERQEPTERFIAARRPDVVVVAAAKVGGIHANDTYPAEFISENLAIARNVIHASYRAGVSKLLFLGSSCIYPRLAAQPMREEQLLTGPLEPTNEWYAVAKIAGIKLCQAYRRQYGVDFISVMPTNLYGPGDNYHPEDSHVLPALIRRFHQAKQDGAPTVSVWGTGAPYREFLFVDDLADACVFVLEHYSDEAHLNVGAGAEATIGQVAELVADVVGYRGTLSFDRSRPDGMPRKLLDSSKLADLGWRARTPLRAGLERTYAAFLAGDCRVERDVAGASA
jgi:GDP-L-fucose synthase